MMDQVEPMKLLNMSSQSMPNCWMKMSHPNVYMENTECWQKLQHNDIGMRSKSLLEDWLKLCDALLISITVQSILAMKLFKDFKLMFTQKTGSQI